MARFKHFAAFSGLGSAAVELHRDWITAREQRLARLTAYPVCPFSWGLEALAGIPGFEPAPAGQELGTFRKANQRWLQNSDEFFAYRRPTGFTLNGTHLQFRSPAQSLYPENDTAYAEYFRCAHADGCAVLVLPHWNAAPGSYASFCRFLNLAGFSALLVTLPYHAARKPRECSRAEYSVSANLGRTIASARQGIIDTLCCLDWLEDRGYRRFGIAGTSLGFGHAFVASALDKRLEVNVFNHCCSTVSDAVWVGMPELCAAFDGHVSQQELRECWSAINPISYFKPFARSPKRSLLIHGRYDTTFAPDYVAELIRRFASARLDYEVVELACGHYTIGDLPFALLSAYRIAEFFKKNLR
jgi:Alpha/beta hydrolase domain containing 18